MPADPPDLAAELRHILEHGTLRNGFNLPPPLLALIEKLGRWPSWPDEYPWPIRNHVGTIQAELLYEGLRLGLKGLDEIDLHLIAACKIPFERVERMAGTEKLERLKSCKAPVGPLPHESELESLTPVKGQILDCFTAGQSRHYRELVDRGVLHLTKEGELNSLGFRYLKELVRDEYLKKEGKGRYSRTAKPRP